MPDTLPPAAAPTLPDPLVNPTGASIGVNSVQATLPPTNTPPTLTPTAEVAYQQRINNLMSEKDKALNERNQAIAAQMELQQQLTSLQSQTSSSLNSSAQAAQAAIDEAKALRARVQVLDGEVLRARLLAEHTELIPYSEFIPATTDENVLRETVQKLNTIRQQDLERSRVTQFPLNQSPTNPAAPQFPGTPQQQQTSAQSLYGLYQNRPNMAPGLPSIPASSPAQMHPAGAQTAAENIDQMLREARNSGKPGDFEAALARAALLANQSVQQQLGRN